MNYYTYTIWFVDGYYYHGYAKYRGRDPLTDGYFGTPVTNKGKWLTTMYWKEITGTYETLEEVTFAEQEAIRPVFNTDPYCLNAACNGAILPECREKGRQTARERGSGFFDPGFQQSDMMKNIRKKNGKKTGNIAAVNGQLTAARSCIDKQNQARAGKENLKKAHQKARKPVEVLLPNGVLLAFDSVSEAASCLNIDRTCISYVAKNPLKRTKGHQARFTK
jgi:hypothetical protein